MSRLSAIALAVLVVLAACRSAPEPVPPPDAEYDQAKRLRTQILEYDLARYAPEEFKAGEAAFADGEAAYARERYADAGGDFREAIASYSRVTDEGFKAISATRKASAAAERDRADAIKAAVATPQEYTAALEVFRLAEAEAAAGNHQKAAELFENAGVLFAQVFTRAEALRAESARRRSAATVEKDRADSVKANVAVPDDYEPALAAYRRGDAETDRGAYGQAGDAYDEAALLFGVAYRRAADKRKQAEEALARVDSSIGELETQRLELEEEARRDFAEMDAAAGEDD